MEKLFLLDAYALIYRAYYAFIRAPRIVAVGKGVDVLAEVRSGDSVFPVAVRQGNVTATSFHPELTEDRAFHRFFVEMCRKRREALRG